ncbi:hypothetical protein MferCBS31731_004438 [Microsporum ferrugineum]
MRSLTLDGCRLERCIPLKSSQFVALRRYSRGSPAKTKSQPSQAQLLRFALTGTTCSGNGDKLDKKLDERLISQFQNSWIPKRSKTIDTISQSLPTNVALPGFTKGDGVSRLQADIETFINSKEAGIKLLSSIEPLQNALNQCQTRVEREDILATVNGLLARLRRLRVKDTSQLLLLGMSYAAESFSPDSLAHYVQQYSIGGYGLLPQPIGFNLINSLLNGLERRSWEDPNIDRSAMLRVVAGLEDERTTTETLHPLLGISHIRDNKLVPKYIRLLGELKGKQIVSELWYKIEGELEAGQNAVVIEGAIASIRAFLKLDTPCRALLAAQKSSKYIDLNEHLPIKSWKTLLEHDSQGLLRSVVAPRTTATMLQRDLSSLEFILGATWVNGEVGRHIHPHGTGQPLDTSAANGGYVSNCDRPNFTSSISFIHQIWAAMQTDGCSRSQSGLSAIADLLNEYEGIEVPLQMQPFDNIENLEYAWLPACSPLEFAGNRPSLERNIDQPLSPASLGLVSVHVDGNGKPVRSLGTVPLMQLGYIGVRASTTNNASNYSDIPEEPMESWRSTGHIIAWDRQSGQLVILWVGKGSGAIEPGLVKPIPPPELPFIFGTITFTEAETLILSQCDSLGPLNNEQPYWVDVDAGSGLIP